MNLAIGVNVIHIFLVIYASISIFGMILTEVMQIVALLCEKSFTTLAICVNVINFFGNNDANMEIFPMILTEVMLMDNCVKKVL
jgi:hypothetical protein